MAECINNHAKSNAPIGTWCENLYECKHEGDVVESTGKKLDRYCFYCLGTPRVKKIGHKASWPGSTPKWCPLGRMEGKHE